MLGHGIFFWRLIVPQVLTEVFIKGSSPKDKPYKVFDTDGLYIEVTPLGTKTWLLRYYQNNVKKRLSFGKWPDIPLKIASELALNFKISLTNETPQPIQEEEITTIDTIPSQYLNKTQYSVTPKDYKRKLYFNTKYINTTIGSLDAKTITPAFIITQTNVIYTGLRKHLTMLPFR
jgi:hypothetical protein